MVNVEIENQVVAEHYEINADTSHPVSPATGQVWKVDIEGGGSGTLSVYIASGSSTNTFNRIYNGNSDDFSLHDYILPSDMTITFMPTGSHGSVSMTGFVIQDTSQ